VTDPARAKFFVNLKIPVHPDYDFDADSGSTDYVPPVKLNNLIILYTNAAIELTESVVRLNRRIEALRLTHRQAERKLEALRSRLLAGKTIPPSAAKNLLLTEAYVRTLALTESRADEMDALDREIAAAEDALDTAKAEVGSLKYTMETVKLACDNIQTHLSYVKQEAKLLGRV
jgi:hypothetical protein